MRFRFQGIGRAAIPRFVEGRVHDGEIEAVVGKSGGDARLAFEGHVGFDHADAVRQTGIQRMRDALAGKPGHEGRTFDKSDGGVSATGGDGKSCGTGTAAEIGNAPGKSVRNGTCQNHRIHTRAMTFQCGLNEVKCPTMEHIEGFSGLIFVFQIH